MTRVVLISSSLLIVLIKGYGQNTRWLKYESTEFGYQMLWHYSMAQGVQMTDNRLLCLRSSSRHDQTEPYQMFIHKLPVNTHSKHWIARDRLYIIDWLSKGIITDSVELYQSPWYYFLGGQKMTFLKSLSNENQVFNDSYLQQPGEKLGMFTLNDDLFIDGHSITSDHVELGMRPYNSRFDHGALYYSNGELILNQVIHPGDINGIGFPGVKIGDSYFTHDSFGEHKTLFFSTFFQNGQDAHSIGRRLFKKTFFTNQGNIIYLNYRCRDRNTFNDSVWVVLSDLGQRRDSATLSQIVFHNFRANPIDYHEPVTTNYRLFDMVSVGDNEEHILLLSLNDSAEHKGIWNNQIIPPLDDRYVIARTDKNLNLELELSFSSNFEGIQLHSIDSTRILICAASNFMSIGGDTVHRSTEYQFIGVVIDLINGTKKVRRGPFVCNPSEFFLWKSFVDSSQILFYSEGVQFSTSNPSFDTINCQASRTLVFSLPFNNTENQTTARHALFTPNAFTPNADDLNDTWLPIHSQQMPFSYSIYDRWGEKIFEGDQETGWDGSKNGELLSSGVYFYVIHSNGELKRGYIQLIR